MKVEVLKRYKDKELNKILKVGDTVVIDSKDRVKLLEDKGFVKSLEVKKKPVKRTKKTKEE